MGRIFYLIFTGKWEREGTEKVLVCTLYLPSSKTEERSQVSYRNINGLMDGGSYMSEPRSWSNTPPCEADRAGRIWQQSLLQGGGRLPVIGVLRSRWLISYQGNQKSPHPHCSFDKLSWWRCSDLKIRRITPRIMEIK